jgi:hypothetical protein
MARTNLPLTVIDPTTGANAPTPTAVDVANGMNIVMASSAIPSGTSMWDLVIVFVNSFAGAKSIIIRAGASNPPAFRKDKGDLSISNAGTSAITYISGLEPARYAQSDGSVNIDFTAATTGTVLALLRSHAV